VTNRDATELAARFWKHVAKRSAQECWLWRGRNVPRGYPSIRIEGRAYKASRVAWWLHHGEWPPRGLHACHHCDTPSCVNPRHLFLGTQRENMRDASKKGRVGNPAHVQVRGERQGHSKLTEEAVRIIRNAPANTATYDALAERFGIARATVYGIRSRRWWKHVV
jgi:hypothetical protein